MKKIIIAILVVFVVWQLLDFVMHGLILRSSYEATPQIWRPMAEMKMGLLMIVSLLSAVSFVWIYARLVFPKNIWIGLEYGLFLGVAFGLGMGYGTYSTIPVPYTMALTWFLGTIIEMATAGFLVALIIKE